MITLRRADHPSLGTRRRVRLGLRAVALATSLPTAVAGALSAQQAAASDSIPELQPRFERVFGADTVQVAGQLRQGSSSSGIAPSPDGRWLLVTVQEADRANLWLVPTAGGEIVRLTHGPYSDGGGQWLPTSDAVLFSSDRPAGAAPTGRGLMRLVVSPDDGQPVGPPRQVSLDPVIGFAVSPDGRQVAYVMPVPGFTSSLRVVPTTGGTARTVLDTPGGILGIRWGTEGRFLRFLFVRDFQVPELAVMEVPVEGGEPRRLSVWDDWVHVSPHGRYVYREVPGASEGDVRYEIATGTGQPLARFDLPAPFALAGFGDGPGQLLAIRQDVVSPLRVVPVAGGPVLRLNEAWGYDVPLSWTPDGREVFFATQLDGEQVYMLAPVDGGPMRQVTLPANYLRGTWPRLSRDGRRVLYRSAGRAEGEVGLWIYDIARDTAFRVDEGKIPSGTSAAGWSTGGHAGGSSQDANFLYGLTRNGRHELREADARGSTRLLWSFPDSGAEPPTVAVHGDRIAFTRNDRHGLEGSLFVARVGEDQERRLLTLPGALGTRGSNPPVWSPDGRMLAMAYRGPGDGDPDGGVLVAEVTESGELVGEPRILPMEDGPTWWWGLTWLPDGQHFLVVGGVGWPEQGEVWLVSLDPDTPPVPVTTDVEGDIYSFTLSPDGRYIAIESEIPRGSSVWRVDLGDVPGGSGAG